jgi:hypothetical protein
VFVKLLVGAWEEAKIIASFFYMALLVLILRQTRTNGHT